MHFTEEPVYFMRQLILILAVSFGALIPNYYGQRVTSMSAELSEAAYGSLWYEQDMKFKKDFKTFLIYLDDEIVFEIKGIFQMDLENFVMVKNSLTNSYELNIQVFKFLFLRCAMPLILCMQF
jgi:hypothetical protein